MNSTIRQTSNVHFCGWPLYEIAYGPDPATGKDYSSVKAILAIGDAAHGAMAIGGNAIGLKAITGSAGPLRF
jgi:hypothetical protein